MADRYHLLLAAVALCAGCAVVLVDRWGRRSTPELVARLATSTSAVAVATGAFLGGVAVRGGIAFGLCALALVVVPERQDRPSPMGRGAVALCVVSLAGVWSAVPDTEPALAMALVLAPLASVRAARGPAVGPVGAASLVLAVLGTALVGSAGRGAAVSTASAVGMLLVAPLVFGSGAGPDRRGRVLLSAIHVLVALFLPRALMTRTTPVATAASLAALVLMGVAATVVRRRLTPVVVAPVRPR